MPAGRCGSLCPSDSFDAAFFKRFILSLPRGGNIPVFCLLCIARGADPRFIERSKVILRVPVAMLCGALVTGFILAIFMANSGGAWDNAKKYIESGHHGGKGSEQHKAAVVGDTVGDPFKDTSGPSINILIKLLSMVSIVFSGLIASFHLF